MTGFTIPGFDEDTHAASNGFGEQTDEPLPVREVEPDLCIECYPQPCSCGVPPAGTRLTLPRWGDVRFYYAAPSGFPELAAAEKISDLTCFSILINYEKQN